MKVCLKSLCRAFSFFACNKALDANPTCYAVVANGLLIYDSISRHKESAMNSRPHSWWVTDAKTDPENNKLVKINFSMEDVGA